MKNKYNKSSKQTLKFNRSTLVELTTESLQGIDGGRINYDKTDPINLSRITTKQVYQ